MNIRESVILKKIFKYSALVLILVAFIISNFESNTQLKPFVFISLLLALPYERKNKWILVLFSGLFVYELFDMFIRSQYFYSATNGYMIFGLGLLGLMFGLIYQFTSQDRFD